MRDRVYRPSVCHQTADAHIHYNVVLLKSPIVDDSNESLMRRLANKAGGRTAGQTMALLLESQLPLSYYGVDYIQKEIIPTGQVCHKGEADSPSIDWDHSLFTPPVDATPPTVGNPQVGHIRHS